MKTATVHCTALNAALVLLFLLPWNCSAAETDGGFVVYPGASGAPGPVVFSHRRHGIDGAGFACDKCHPSASVKTVAIVKDGIHQRQGCGACHDGKTEGPRNPIKAAPIQDCDACHAPAKDIVITLNRMDPVSFSHIRHLAVGADTKTSGPAGFCCGDCHPMPFERISKGPIGMEVPHESESGGCAHCHNGQKRNDGNPTAFPANTRCLTCHK